MFSWLAQLPQSSRSLGRDPAFSLPVFLCLAVTIGSATAVFGVVDAVLLRPLPVLDESRLRSVVGTQDATGDQQYGLDVAALRAITESTDTFVSAAWWQQGTVALTGGDEPLRLDSAEVGPDFFLTLGTPPLLGGGFSAAAREGEAVAYLSEGLWRSEFGADPEILGRRLIFDGEPTTVAGVVAGAGALPPDADVWVPLLLEDIPQSQLHSGNKSFVGRLAGGIDDAELERRLRLLDGDLERIYPAEYATRSLVALSLRETIIGDQGQLLLVLLVAVGLLLVLGCSNVANLVLVRNRQRRLAVATRVALGGTHGAVVSWLLGELLLLGAAAAGTGTALASVMAPAMLQLTQIVGPGMDPRFDLRSLVFITTVTLVAGLAAGLMPALGATRVDLAAVLRDGSGRTSSGRAARRSQGLLVGCQAAVGVLLVVAAGQTLGELRRLGSVDPGYRPDGALTFQVHAPASRYPDRAAFLQVFSEIRLALGAVPGVEKVGGASRLPVGYAGTWFSHSIEERPPANPADVKFARGYPVSVGYFEAIGIRLLEGRLVEPSDTADSPGVVVVSEAFAEHNWPGESALGKRIKRRTYTSAFPWLTVVGIVENVPTDGLAGAEGVAIYMPNEQAVTSFSRFMAFVVRSDRPVAQLLPEIRARIATIDPDLPLARVKTMEQLVSDTFADRRLAGGLLAIFAGIGLVLLGTGTYGVVGFAVGQRRVELGLRSALGADGGTLLRMVLRDNLVYLGTGTLVGLVAAATVAGSLDESTLPPVPPWLYVLAAVLLLAVGMTASLQPAWRAARLDPTSSLRGGTE